MNSILKKNFSRISLVFAFLPILFLTLAIMVAFAFSQSGLALGGILTIGFLCLMPISNITGFVIGIIGLVKKINKRSKIIFGIVINGLFIFGYILYFIGWMLIF